MSDFDFSKIDLARLDRDIQEQARQERERGWWSRNWLWFVPSLLLGMVIICCGCPAGFIFYALNKVYDFEVFQVAMQKIEADKDIQKELGQPITTVRWPPPSFQIEETNGRGEANIHWDIEGPKGRAKAHATARLNAAKWEIVILEVTLSNGKKLNLTGDDDTNKAPVFEGTKTAPKPGNENAPPPEVNLPAIPEGGPPGN